jgi:hypothetical protein
MKAAQKSSKAAQADPVRCSVCKGTAADWIEDVWTDPATGDVLRRIQWAVRDLKPTNVGGSKHICHFCRTHSRKSKT